MSQVFYPVEILTEVILPGLLFNLPPSVQLKAHGLQRIMFVRLRKEVAWIKSTDLLHRQFRTGLVQQDRGALVISINTEGLTTADLLTQLPAGAITKSTEVHLLEAALRRFEAALRREVLLRLAGHLLQVDHLAQDQGIIIIPVPADQVERTKITGR